MFTVNEGGSLNFGSDLVLEDADSANSEVNASLVIVEITNSSREFLISTRSNPDIQVVSTVKIHVFVKLHALQY